MNDNLTPNKVQKYQIIAQVLLGACGVLGYMILIGLIILHPGEWSQFQEVQIASAISFLAGTVVSGVFSYAFGSSFGSMTKDAMFRREDNQPPQEPR